MFFLCTILNHHLGEYMCNFFQASNNSHQPPAPPTTTPGPQDFQRPNPDRSMHRPQHSPLLVARIQIQQVVPKDQPDILPLNCWPKITAEKNEVLFLRETPYQKYLKKKPGGYLLKTQTLMVLLMVQKILHLLRLVDSPIIYRLLYIPGGCLGFLPSTFFGCEFLEMLFDEFLFYRTWVAILFSKKPLAGTHICKKKCCQQLDHLHKWGCILKKNTSFFQVTLWSPKRRSLNPWKGHR